MQTMLGSRYVAVIQADVELWNSKLNLVADMMDEWLTFQRNWVCLRCLRIFK